MQLLINAIGIDTNGIFLLIFDKKEYYKNFAVKIWFAVGL